MVPNDTANVSNAKGVAGGYLLSAPRTQAVVAAIPSLASLSTQLPSAFSNLGYVAADGITESESAATEVETDVDGRPVNVTRHDRTEQVRVRLVEVRASALGEQHGHSNVVVGGDATIVHHNNLPRDHRVYVAELVLKNGRRWRKVIPDGQVTEVGDLSLSSSELVGREVTISCNSCGWTLGGTSHMDTAFDVIGASSGGGSQGVDPGGNEEGGNEGGTTPTGSGTALLASLTTSATLSPAFSPQVTAYTATTSSETFTVSAVPDDPAATMAVARLGGVQYQLASGESRSFELQEGSNSVWVWVTNPNTSEAKTYKVSVTFQPA